MPGGSEKVVEAGAVLCGGHSINDADIKYGLSVNGIVHPDKIYTNNKGQPGDVLILTKKLGVGIINAAGVRYILEKTTDAIFKIKNSHARLFYERIKSVKGVKLYGDFSAPLRSPVQLFPFQYGGGDQNGG